MPPRRGAAHLAATQTCSTQFCDQPAVWVTLIVLSVLNAMLLRRDPYVPSIPMHHVIFEDQSIGGSACFVQRCDTVADIVVADAQPTLRLKLLNDKQCLKIIL